jgi:hypothetical protein
VNPFSGVEVPLSDKQRSLPARIWKLAFSEAPTSKHCVLGAITYGLALCRVGCRNHSWWISEKHHHYEDILFRDNGKKLYGVYGCVVFVHDIRMTKRGTPVVSTTCKLRADQQPIRRLELFNMHYLVEYKDTLLMVVRISRPKDYIFRVFKLVVNAENNSACYDYAWAEATTLDDHALFLSRKCSRAVRVPASGVERNHIYYDYVNLLGKDDFILDDAQLTWRDVGNLHCKKNKKGNGTDRIMSTGYYVTGRRWGLTWILPPDF